MSAICGAVGLDGRPWSDADLGGMLGLLSPLGGDGGGTWSGTAGRCGVSVAAALRRSTPEDAADRQPAQSADGSLVLVADLRLDNRDELAPFVGLADERSVPDSAFVLAAYERWGEAMLDRIVGDFALAIVDRGRGGVLIARDHAGLRPLLLHHRAGVVAFASTALALTRFEGVGHALDVRRAAEVLVRFFDSDRTFVEGVHSLPPATAAWIDASGMRRWTWWKADPHTIVDLGSPALHEAELRDAFDHAVAARLRSVGGIGASVSGGLDSPSAAATAARLLAPEPLRTYTAAPPPGWRVGAVAGWDADESPLVRDLADLHPNMIPSFAHIPPGGSLFAVHEPQWALGAPAGGNPCNMLWVYEIRLRAAHDGVATLLTGVGGNTVFSADGPDWLAALVRAGRPAAALREAAAWSRATGRGRLRTLRNQLVYPLLPFPARRLARAVTGRANALEDRLEETALRPELAADLLLELEDRWALRELRRRPDLRSLGLVAVRALGSVSETQATITALTGVEEREPVVDRRVLEAALRQPEWVRRHDGMTRAVARGAMAGRLPPAIANRTLRGEQLPDWLDLMTAARGELAAELDQLRHHATSRELIDVPRLELLMDRWPDRAMRADRRVERDYRMVLLHALFVSRYLRWFAAHATNAGTPDVPRVTV